MNTAETSIPGVERLGKTGAGRSAWRRWPFSSSLGFRDPVQFFRSYLFAFVFWIGLPLGCSAILDAS